MHLVTYEGNINNVYREDGISEEQNVRLCGCTGRCLRTRMSLFWKLRNIKLFGREFFICFGRINRLTSTDWFAEKPRANIPEGKNYPKGTVATVAGLKVNLMTRT